MHNKQRFCKSSASTLNTKKRHPTGNMIPCSVIISVLDHAASTALIAALATPAAHILYSILYILLYMKNAAG